MAKISKKNIIELNQDEVREAISDWIVKKGLTQEKLAMYHSSYRFFDTNDAAVNELKTIITVSVSKIEEWDVLSKQACIGAEAYDV